MTDKNLPAKSNESLPALPKTDVEQFIMKAIDKNVSVETMERLLEMRDKLRKEQAKAAYDSALSCFQAACPIIKKDHAVMNKGGAGVRYTYAPLDSIISQIKEKLKDHGFSYMVTAEIVETGTADKIRTEVKATCKATHVLGHSESSSFKVPIDKDAYMNEQQKVASALTYAKRYAFCNAFGIMTGDADDDSNANEQKPAAATTPAPAKPATPAPATAAPASGAPTTKPEERGTVSGIIKDVVRGPQPIKGTKDQYRWKIVLDDNSAYYTFDTKLVELAQAEAANGPVTIIWKKGTFGKDIDSMYFRHMQSEEAFKKDFCGPENADK